MKNSIESAANQVRDILSNFIRTEYFFLEINDKEYKIRVSDHSANDLNNERTDCTVFSFVLSKNRQLRNMANEWIVDNNGDFSEEFSSIEECLDWQIN